MSSPTRLKVAVVGTGISGLSAAWLLHPRHDVTIYEKAGRIGGHSNTVSAKIGGAELAVDAGFIVFNPVTYPNFVQLLRVLGVESRASDMSFAVSLEGGRIPERGNRASATLSLPKYRLSMTHVLVIGASKGIGLETTQQALEAGHCVRAFARSADGINLSSPKLQKVRGDALNSKDVDAALEGAPEPSR